MSESAAQDHVCGPDCQCGCEAGRTIPVRSAATTDAEWDRLIDRLTAIGDGHLSDRTITPGEAQMLLARIGSLQTDQLPRLTSLASAPSAHTAAQTDCPACEEGYICHQGEGCLLAEVFGDEQPAATALSLARRSAATASWDAEAEGNKLILLFEGYIYGDASVSEGMVMAAINRFRTKQTIELTEAT